MTTHSATTDEQHAGAVRNALQAAHDALFKARKAGLKVDLNLEQINDLGRNYHAPVNLVTIRREL